MQQYQSLPLIDRSVGFASSLVCFCDPRGYVTLTGATLLLLQIGSPSGSLQAVTPTETPTADALQKSVQKFWKDGMYPLYKFLFRGHPGADPDLFQRMEDAKTNQAVLAERVAVLETENKRLLASFGAFVQVNSPLLRSDES